jgi:hypothetical protein
VLSQVNLSQRFFYISFFACVWNAKERKERYGFVYTRFYIKNFAKMEESSIKLVFAEFAVHYKTMLWKNWLVNVRYLKYFSGLCDPTINMQWNLAIRHKGQFKECQTTCVPHSNRFEYHECESNLVGIPILFMRSILSLSYSRKEATKIPYGFRSCDGIRVLK